MPQCLKFCNVQVPTFFLTNFIGVWSSSAKNFRPVRSARAYEFTNEICFYRKSFWFMTRDDENSIKRPFVCIHENIFSLKTRHNFSSKFEDVQNRSSGSEFRARKVVFSRVR